MSTSLFQNAKKNPVSTILLLLFFGYVAYSIIDELQLITIIVKPFATWLSLLVRLSPGVSTSLCVTLFIYISSTAAGFYGCIIS